MAVKKLVHITDLHIGYEFTYNNPKVTCRDRLTVISNLIRKKCTPFSEYIIVVTGDLMDNAHFSNMRNDAKAFIEQLRRDYKVLLIPGNHDYGSGAVYNPNCVKPFNEAFFGRSQVNYPLVDFDGQGQESIAFIGLDSNLGELHFLDRIGADGELGTGQLSLLAALLKNQTIRDAKYRVIYLHHHPFESPQLLHNLKDADEFMQVLTVARNDGIAIDALLFGHNHGGCPFHGKLGIPRVYDGGTAGGKNKPSFFRIMDLSTPNPFNDQLVGDPPIGC